MSETGLKKDPSVCPPAPAPCSALMVGDHRISRSLLLLAAVTAASERGIKVLFLAQTQIQSLPVFLQRCSPSLSPESLKVELRHVHVGLHIQYKFVYSVLLH